MKKILLTCFLALPFLFQKARIKLKAKKEHLGFPSPSTAPQCDVLIKYLAPGVFHPAKRSVFREAYFQNKATWIGTYSLILTLLCSSISPTLSKSAQSPPEPSIHRSAVHVSPHSGDTHRGEETLSDTFTQVDDGAEVSSPANYTTSLTTLDGGPMLRTLVLSTLPTRVGKFEASDIRHRTSLPSTFSRLPASTNETASLRAFTRSDAPQHRTSDTQHRTSLPSSVSRLPSLTNFGLINPDQDMGAGEGIADSQPAPFPVLSSQINSGREAYSRIAEAKSLGSNVSCAERSRSARLQSFHPDYTFLFLRFELEGIPTQTPTKLSVSLSSQELDARHDYLHTVEDSMTLSSGDFLSGTMGLQLGEMKIPFSTGIGRVRLKLDSQTLLQDIWVQPNDSLRVTVDARTGKVLFLGPHKDKFRLQIQLQDLAAAWTKSINPIMLTSNKERILDSPDKRDYYQKIAEIQATGWNRKLELLAEDSERLARARFLLNSAGEDHPVFQELKRYQEELGPDFFNWLWLFWKGKLKKQALDYMVLTQASSPEWGQMLLGYALEDEELSRIKALEEFPMEFAEALYIENFLLEIYSGIAFVHLTDTLPAPLQSQVNAFYLVRQYKELTAPDSMISALIEKSSSPWIRKYLRGILNGNLTGSQFINEPFWNEQGELVYPESWKGKLVFLDFWLSGCGACLAFAKNKFHPLLEEFGTHPDILFVTITGDSDRELWKSSLSKNLFTTASAQNLYAAGVTHPALRQYHIQSFPEQMLLDREGKILQVGGFPNDLEGWKQLLRTYLKQDNLSTQILTHLQSN